MKKLPHQKMLKCLGTLSGVFMSALVMAQPLTGSYTINQNLLTSGTNYQSFNTAIAALQNNGVSGSVTFEISPDTYNEQVVITPVTGTSATNTITFHGNEGSTISYNPDNTTERAIIKLNDADHIVLSNLNIIATGNTITQYGYGVQLMNNADHNVIENCVISTSLTTINNIAPNYAGIIIAATDIGLAVNGSGFVTGLGDAQCDHNIIRNNTIRGGYFSIAIGGNGASSVVSNNEISGNQLTDFYRTGIYLNGNMNTKIFDNDISRPDRPPNTAFQFYGFWLDGYSSGLSVSANKIHDPFGNNPTSGSTCHPIYIQNSNADEGNENVFTNNTIYNLNSNGTLSAIDITSSSRFHFVHNTISMDDPYSTAFTTKGVATTNSSYITFTNNILNFTRGGSSFATKHAYYLSGGTNNMFDYNDVHTSSVSGTLYLGQWGATNYIDLTAWQNGAAFDQNSTDVDPQFINAVSGYLLPQNTNLQIADLGTGVTTDILGLGRSSTAPTIGAFEINGTVLPVQLSPLTGKLSAQGIVILAWETLNESNNRGFIIERSVDGKLWDNAGFVPTRAISGNSTETLSYTFNDNETLSSTRFYRLQQTDIDGSTTFSNVVTLNPIQHASGFSVRLYPNPATTTLQFDLGSHSSAEAELAVIDLTGRIVLRQHVKNQHIVLDISKLVKGMHLLRVTNGKEIFSSRFVKTR